MNKNVLISNIRNFCIISHIDHGKSTLSNKIIEFCNKNSFNKKISNLLLDNMELEIKRGITIKSKIVTSYYIYNNLLYKFNLIDTPGHIDFYYEIKKMIKICNGALLIIDSTKGIQSQTLFNYNLAIKNKLKIIYIISKIDLNTSNINKTVNDLKYYFKIKESDCLLYSSKNELGINKLINKIINYIPSPNVKQNTNLVSMVLDIKYDNKLGILILIFIKSGFIKVNSIIKNLDNYFNITINKIIIPYIDNIFVDKLNSGDIGWISFKERKNILNISINDYIIYNINKKFNYILKNKFYNLNYKIYSSFFPHNINDFTKLKNSIIKYSLNDLSLYYEKDYSNVFGFGFRCGFLGPLHMEIVKSRLEIEFKLKIINIFSNINYRFLTKDNNILNINKFDNIDKYNIKEIEEPICICNIIFPNIYLNEITKLFLYNRGKQLNIININNYLKIKYFIPMSEMTILFFNKIKSISKGYADFNYKFSHFEKSDLYIIKILINKILINQLTFITHKNNIKKNVLEINNKLINIIKKKQFNINIEILSNNKVIFKNKIKQYMKNVISKCYGGDITRKKKLLMKQKMGKKKINNISYSNIRINDIIKSFFKISNY